ncbi:MAG: hypothetical protein ABEK12_00295, partial [Candidatus Nanohaloarchaea archaeon]
MMRRAALFLAAAVLVAGCTAVSGQQKTEKPDAVAVSGPDCFIGEEPCSTVDATKFSGDAEISVTVANNGDAKMSVDMGGNGRNVMVSTCNKQIASLENGGSFTAERSGPGGTEDVSGQESVQLQPGQTLSMRWTMNIAPGGGDISKLGYACKMEFELTFDQVLRSARQIQLKQNTDVPDVPSLDATTTSKRPVRLVIDAPSSFVPASGGGEGQQKFLVTQAYLKNVGDGTVTDIKAINPETSGVLQKNNRESCGPQNDALRMYGAGKRKGESYRKICTLKSNPLSSQYLGDGSSAIGRTDAPEGKASWPNALPRRPPRPPHGV